MLTKRLLEKFAKTCERFAEFKPQAGDDPFDPNGLSPITFTLLTAATYVAGVSILASLFFLMNHGL